MRVARALVASAARHQEPARAIAAARTLRRRELARIASADLLGMLDVTDVCKALTSVWVAVLRGGAGRGDPRQHARRRAARTHRGDRDGPTRRRRTRVRSDADVMFVCEPVGDVEESVGDPLVGDRSRNR